jgi:lysophospholipase L1-like esterase
MTTKNEMIEIIKAENPNGLRSGNDADGYVDFTPAEYEATIAEWAEARLAKEAKIAADLAEAEAKAIAKADAAQKLTALGIDPKALGL